jgi:REP element-mobilizing transposase RayT
LETSRNSPNNPQINHRRSIRLQEHDYSWAGLYFVTICVQNQKYLFGNILDGEMILNNAGQIALQTLLEIPQHFPATILHDHIIMPNHIHVILELIANNAVGANNYSPLQTPPPIAIRANNYSPLHDATINIMMTGNQHPTGTSKTIGSIIRGFKIGVTKQIGYSIWQRNYYEHIIRDANDYARIVDYIMSNPAKWLDDTFYNG